MEKSFGKCAPKASPRPLFYFVKWPKTAIACKNFFQKIFWKGTIKNILTQSLLTVKVIKNKRSLELATSCSLSYETSSQIHKKQLYIIWPIWWCNIKWFLSYSKNYICKFMHANSWHHKLFHLHLSFWIWKLWKERGKITKIWISREQKDLFRWNKKHFS